MLRLLLLDAREMPDLPSGTVTFFFTDIEASTRLLQQLGDRHAQVLATYRQVLRDALAQHRGVEVDASGDSFFAVFPRPSDALRAACDAQRAVAGAAWPDGVTVRARIGVHTGEAVRTEHSYVGMDVHRTARICDAAHGGQVLVSRATHDLVEDDLPAGLEMHDLGEHRLRDLQRSERLFQLVHADLPARFPALRSLGSLPNNLPRQLTSFVGRERELAEAKRLLGHTYLLTLTGPAGSGKTRLALHLASDLLEEFQHGVWFVGLAPVEDPNRVIGAIAAALAVREQPGRSIEATLIDYLRAKDLLLILDGCEHLVEGAASAADALLRAGPKLRIVATSREPLHIAGETLMRVPSLSTPDPKNRAPVDSVRRFEAVRLFADRASSAQPGFALTEQNAPWVALICHRLDGIPLAIELAAARLNALPVEQIAARLDDRFRLLTGGNRTAERRQRTLRAAIDWSYELLNDRERMLFRRLSVFVGGFTLDAAEAVCSGEGCEADLVLDLLTRLVDRSLVMSAAAEGGGESRFWMLETVRQYAAEALQQAGEWANVRRRHLEFFLALAMRAELELRGPRQIEWLNTLEREHDNLRAAIKWGQSDQGTDAAVLRLANALRWFWFMRGYLTEGREALEGGIAGGHRGTAAEQAWALSAAALLAWRQRDYSAAALLGERSETLSHEAHDDRACAYALNALALVARDRGELERADALHQETLERFTRAGDHWGVALANQNLAYVAHRRGDYARAAALAESALATFRQVKDRWGIATTEFILGRMALRQGLQTRASEFFDEAMALFHELGDKPMIAFTRVSLGQLAIQQRDHERARGLLEESLAYLREMADKRGIADATAYLGVLAFERGDHGAAASMHRESLTLNAELGNRQGIAEGLEWLANVAVAESQPQHAVLLLGAADALRELIGVPVPETSRGLVAGAASVARERLGADAFGAAWSQGRATPLKQAVQSALG